MSASPALATNMAPKRDTNTITDEHGHALVCVANRVCNAHAGGAKRSKICSGFPAVHSLVLSDRVHLVFYFVCFRL